MPADHLHPAIDIPGEGLWRGAVVQPARGGDLGLVDRVTQYPCGGRTVVTVTGYMSAFAPADLLRDLTAPAGMGLGLAGLAVRVAERAWGEIDVLRPGLDRLADDLCDEPWALPHWRYGLDTGSLSIADVIREAATYIARTDRLAALTRRPGGATLLAGDVCLWRRTSGGWMLAAPASESVPFHVDTSDPLAALGAALEVCGG